ncbi:hypothetical protein [Nocardioides sp. B-3]|uniref:hypothetical protein n=1 Tax=Nocardioides sp. B-3 TaxID=2895565 RepID=UPI00215325EF|nr:hypothetical protein [Nocardioides sp. B-3]UUZ60149.1 hypothetical protein LP418_04140 [Nocardioides sp. B-3]
MWERPFVGAPLLDVGGEVLLATAGCGAGRIDLSTGRTISTLDVACSDRLLVGHGVAVVSSSKPRVWRAVDVASGSTVSEVTPPASLSDPRRILTTDPLTVLAGVTRDNHLQLVRLESDELRVLDDVSDVAAGASFFETDESLVLADPARPGATRFSLEDGSSLGGFPGVGAEQWIPIAHLGDGVLGFEGDEEGLNAGRGLLTLRSLRDGSVTELGELGDGAPLGDTNSGCRGTQGGRHRRHPADAEPRQRWGAGLPAHAA